MRILLADDHELVRAGIRPLLNGLAGTISVIEADSYDSAMTVADEGDLPDLAILDLRMPDTGGEGIRGFRRRFPTVPVVVLSGSNSPEDIIRACQAGVMGYVLKTFSGPTLLHALNLIIQGEPFFPASALKWALAQSPCSGGGTLRQGTDRPAPQAGSLLGRLSTRERDILSHMIQGSTNKEIARQLEVQEITVKVHLRNIYRKLGAVNRAQAVRIAMEDGWRNTN